MKIVSLRTCHSKSPVIVMLAEKVVIVWLKSRKVKIIVDIKDASSPSWSRKVHQLTQALIFINKN